MVDAIPTNPAHRELVTPDTVVAILHALELAPRQESTAMEQTQLRLPEPVVCEFARLRAPPLA
jgi:hypothetical protein